jgi:hypothetical protein
VDPERNTLNTKSGCVGSGVLEDGMNRTQLFHWSRNN